MKPKKLLVVGDFISGSGLTQFIFNMFPHFDTNKFNIQCVGYGIDPKDETKKKCEELGWQLDRVIPITKKPLHHIRWLKKIISILYILITLLHGIISQYNMQNVIRMPK